jgi:hypothetical protein
VNRNACCEIVSQPTKGGTLKIAVPDFERISPIPSLLPSSLSSRLVIEADGNVLLDLHHLPQQ